MAYIVAKEEFVNYSGKQMISGYSEGMSDYLRHDPENFDLNAIVNDLNGEIVYQNNLFANCEGSLIINSDRTFTINILNSTSTVRDNFTIAHELGHYFIHALSGNILDNRELLEPIFNEQYPLLNFDDDFEGLIFQRFGTDQTDRLEWEANWFASAFLMPTERMNEINERFHSDIDLISAYFSVSRAAAKIRLENLT